MRANLPEEPIILYDGVCHLCDAAIRFVLARDEEGVFRFAPLDSEIGRRLSPGGASRSPGPDSVVLVEGGQTWVESDAAVRIAARLPRPWSALALLGSIPRPLRDAAYRFVARNRYRWFGRMDRCPAPSEELRERLLD